MSYNLQTFMAVTSALKLEKKLCPMPIENIALDLTKLVGGEVLNLILFLFFYSLR